LPASGSRQAHDCLAKLQDVTQMLAGRSVKNRIRKRLRQGCLLRWRVSTAGARHIGLSTGQG
jgi:hypothetical protein